MDSKLFNVKKKTSHKTTTLSRSCRDQPGYNKDLMHVHLLIEVTLVTDTHEVQVRLVVEQRARSILSCQRRCRGERSVICETTVSDLCVKSLFCSVSSVCFCRGFGVNGNLTYRIKCYFEKSTSKEELAFRDWSAKVLSLLLIHTNQTYTYSNLLSFPKSEVKFLLKGSQNRNFSACK